MTTPQRSEGDRRAGEALDRAAAAAADPALGASELRGTLSAVVADARRLRRKLEKVIAISDVYQQRLRSAQRDLLQLKDLFLPICMFCKRVRTDDEYWDKIESYFARRAAVSFSHGICPTCMEQHYGGDPAPQDPAPAAEPPRTPPAVVPAAEERLVAELRALGDPERSRLRSGADPQALADRCERTLARYRKALEISDGYQSEFQARLAAAARVDSLTGLATRTAAMDLIEAMQGAHEAVARSTWLILLDVDGMGGLNVRAGYETGDRLLIALGRILRTTCAHARLRARWGGDAFAVLVVSDARRAMAMAEDLLTVVRGTELPGRGRPGVTVSIGLSPSPDRGVDAWIAAAEGALREARRAGGDRASAAPT